MDEELRRLGALEALEELLLGHTVHHRREDAWDLLDSAGRVAAVICVRKRSGFLTISLPPGPERQALRPEGPIVMPYGEEVIAHVTPDGEPPINQRKKDSIVLSTAQAHELLARVTTSPGFTRAEGKAIAAEIVGSAPSQSAK